MTVSELIEKMKRNTEPVEEIFQKGNYVWIRYYSPKYFVTGTVLRLTSEAGSVSYLVKPSLSPKDLKKYDLILNYNERGHEVKNGNCEWFHGSLLSKKLNLPGLLLINELNYE